MTTPRDVFAVPEMERETYVSRWAHEARNKTESLAHRAPEAETLAGLAGRAEREKGSESATRDVDVDDDEISVDETADARASALRSSPASTTVASGFD